MSLSHLAPDASSESTSSNPQPIGSIVRDGLPTPAASEDFDVAEDISSFNALGLCDTTVPSSAASYAGSSVPTTPDVQLDTGPPHLNSSSSSPNCAASSCFVDASMNSDDSLAVGATGVVLCCDDGSLLHCNTPKRRLSHDSGACELEDNESISIGCQ